MGTEDLRKGASSFESEASFFSVKQGIALVKTRHLQIYEDT